jgi:putative solute:sodium symporter small subunit
LLLVTDFLNNFRIILTQRAQTKYYMESQKQKMQNYWKRNIRTLLILLTVWFIVSFGFGVLLVEPLNSIKIGGYKLGFWFAQQGSIFSFVAIIFVYVYRMNKLDEEFDVNEK